MISEAARQRAQKVFKQEERERVGHVGTREYEAHGRTLRDNMERLRALRLAKEAQEKQSRERS